MPDTPNEIADQRAAELADQMRLIENLRLTLEDKRGEIVRLSAELASQREINRNLSESVGKLDVALAEARAEIERQKRLWDEEHNLRINDLDKINQLKAQLPEEMEECTILFKKCRKGHGRLTATNWIDQGCPWCEIERLSTAPPEDGMAATKIVGAYVDRVGAYDRDEMEFQQYESDLIDEIARALTAAREAERQKQESIDQNICQEVKDLWLKEKPSSEAQRIRSEVGAKVDRDDLAPEYVWDLLDIVAQRAIGAERQKYAAVVEAIGVAKSQGLAIPRVIAEALAALDGGQR